MIPAQIRRRQLLEGQDPFAIILGCSDSRVPAEAVFDQGLGDLLVIRVAGNIVAPSLIGSGEFAAEKFGTRLVVAMGHTGCGAVEATLAELRHDGEALMREAVPANIRASAQQLRVGSPHMQRLIRDDGLPKVG